MSSGFTQVAIINNFSIPIQIGVSYTHNTDPIISVWPFTPIDRKMAQEIVSKLVDEEKLEFSKCTVPVNVINKALSLWKSANSDNLNKISNHPWVIAAKLLWDSDPKIGINALVAGC